MGKMPVCDSCAISCEYLVKLGKEGVVLQFCVTKCNVVRISSVCTCEYLRGQRRKLEVTRKHSERLGNRRECSREVVMEGDEEIVVECGNLGLFVYREMPDLSPVTLGNDCALYTCPL